MNYILKFSNKAKTLQKLKIHFKEQINIPHFLFFTKRDINKNDDVINIILKKFKNLSIIMRSSALDEDNYNNSNAGKYDSVIIKKISKDKIKNGLKKMFIKLKSDKDVDVNINQTTNFWKFEITISYKKRIIFRFKVYNKSIDKLLNVGIGHYAIGDSFTKLLVFKDHGNTKTNHYNRYLLSHNGYATCRLECSFYGDVLKQADLYLFVIRNIFPRGSQNKASSKILINFTCF